MRLETHALLIMTRVSDMAAAARRPADAVPIFKWIDATYKKCAADGSLQLMKSTLTAAEDIVQKKLLTWAGDSIAKGLLDKRLAGIALWDSSRRPAAEKPKTKWSR